MLTIILTWVKNTFTSKWFSTNWKMLLIGILIVIILLQRCGGHSSNVKVGTTKDSVISKKVTYIPVHDTLYVDTIPPIIKRIPIIESEIPANYIPSGDFDSLKQQYISLRNDFLAKNVYDRKFPIDAIGYVELKDTTNENKLQHFTFISNLKYPVTTVTKTITITDTFLEKPKNQVYIGLGIIGNQSDLLSGVSGGFLLKNKKDQIFGVGAIYDNSELRYELSTYWKIKL